MANIEKILAIIAAIVLAGVIALPIYEHYGRQDMVLIIKFHDQADPFQTLSHVMPSQTVVRSVKQVDRAHNEYLVTVNTPKKRKELVDWLLNSTQVEKVQSFEKTQRVRP